MKYVVIFFICFSLTNSYAQSFTNFKWDSEDIVFKTVQMNFYSTTEKNVKTQIFDGYKDALITITPILSDNPTNTQISVKLSGYYEAENASVNEFVLKSKNYQTEISYNADTGSDLIYVTIYIDEITKKTKKIFIAVLKNYTYDKNAKTLIFILTGFE